MASAGRPLSSLVEVVAPPVPATHLDAVDLDLLRLLVGDSRLSQRSIARALGMSAPAVGDRIARLERTGVIRGYTVAIGWAAAGSPMTVFVTVTAVQGHSLATIIERLRELPEVADVSLVTGAIDLLARLVVRDHNHLQQLLLERVWQIAGVQRTETLLTLAEMRPKDFAGQLIGSMRANVPDARVHQGGTA